MTDNDTNKHYTTTTPTSRNSCDRTNHTDMASTSISTPESYAGASAVLSLSAQPQTHCRSCNRCGFDQRADRHPSTGPVAAQPSPLRSPTSPSTVFVSIMNNKPFAYASSHTHGPRSDSDLIDMQRAHLAQAREKKQGEKAEKESSG